MQTLEGIEMTVRQKIQAHVSPELGNFLLERLQVQSQGDLERYLENCCLRLSGTLSYEQAEQDLAYLTGIRVSAKTQQRLVHRQTFDLPAIEQPIEELSVDGGKVRVRTPLGEPCEWKDYKAIATDQGMLANFQNNAQLIDWVNEQSLAQPVVCLGDGHDGIWNIIGQLATAGQRLEILDWYHLVKNLHKVGGAIKWLNQAEALLWQGQVEATIAVVKDCKRKEAKTFCEYLRKHRHRIVNYEYYQAEGLYSIGSGAVASAIKQIGRRVQLSGAQWNRENVPQVLAHRCAYLNGLIGSPLPAS
jgi:hypothetical protein